MSTRDFLNNQQGIRQTNSAEYEQAMQKYTPVNQQHVGSHVVTPLLIAFIVSLVLTLMTLAAMITYWRVNAFVLSMVFGGSFLFVFGRRIGVADKVLWAIENMLNLDLNDDNQIGIAPRSVPVNTANGSRDVPLDDKPAELFREDWTQAAIAILNKRGNVSWRGIYKNCKISQSKAQAVAKHLKAGYSDGLEINERGWDWLVAYLPEHVDCLIERPDSPTPPHD